MTGPARRRIQVAALALAVLAAVALGVALLRELRGPAPAAAAPLPVGAPDPAAVARGAYLARAGNCGGCHSAPGGAEMAGGRGIDTPFGTVYAGNLTPDPETGLGGWSAEDFWRALHHGRSRDGRLLVPVFPYPEYTRVRRADADDLYAYLRSLPAVRQSAPAHTLRFPFDTPLALAAWRLLYFTPGEQADDPARDAAWNRGRYLVRGLGHCGACHTPRNALGGPRDADEFGGGPIPMQRWIAPSLASAAEAGVADWSDDEVVALLQTGRSARGIVTGPMAEVVFHSTQHLRDEDLRAMARYLRTLAPAGGAAPRSVAMTAPPPGPAPAEGPGARLYARHCADCHGDRGQGRAGAYPALAGNRTVTLDSPVNLLRTVLLGGFGPVTAGNPRPYGMPPYAGRLNDEELAALATYLRQAWGHAAPPVSALDVLAAR
ncbi:putative diheme cytochrome c-553 [Piscinibacter sakaiensis]|uniref:Putative diheme cytochrome c-553 n=1 Tax=Piscinibacter sakaiensis TaxID=1547922 RepID=A0A0K8P5S9_PISS1|nr:putative diheme cytochrome c-553 [Piscinibacter sakaiensis]